ncbi:hypothetical protein TWF506_010104 [Arthrobotrys conoides]|uniref:Uncharacterized protein n=1 Tax=Arthrobotrys conoides TaxID=74498 RepID=A0AAN8NGJ1_9PEZI
MTGEELTSLSFLDYGMINSGLDGRREEGRWVDISLSSSLLLKDALFSQDAIDNLKEEGGFQVCIFHPRLWGDTPWFPNPNVPFLPTGNNTVNEVIQTIKNVFVEKYLDEGDNYVYEISLSHEREEDEGIWKVVGTIERIEVNSFDGTSEEPGWNEAVDWGGTVDGGWGDDGVDIAWDS